ncbi:thioredoxin family protein [Zavarzinella formosa]|uniref:thioredoxin family protein n=1 Tax=Zavarzinella formosa TaxID=360055 RepID=UPI000374D7F1|nr:thioredoxin family protein [Zavarzinella formosa]
MARTPSTMKPLGTPAPDFSLPDTDGKTVNLSDFQNAPALLVAFICNHCPYVKHIRSAFTEMAKEFQAKGAAVVAISSNDALAYPADGPAAMAVEKAEAGYTFPYLYDESQAVALAYQAACTPDFFLYDANKKLAYRGQMDDTRPSNGLPNDGKDLRAAMEAVLAGKPAPETQKASIGCNIKWKPGQEPAY